MNFRILGPLEVRVDGVAVAVGGPLRRAPLTTLPLSPNRVLARDHPLDWPDGARVDRARPRRYT